MEKIAQEKGGETGLIIGKFMPPHRGHVHLIKSARPHARRLTILVCTQEGEPIPGELRYRWMRELFPEDNVLHLTDPNPAEPHEHPDFWKLWKKSIRRLVPRTPDMVFTSESYGDELARHLGALHIAIDPQRRRFPVSGTAIRKDPFSFWDMLPECTRPYYVKRVVLLGAESTGKTTLAAVLAKAFDTEWVGEYAREYVDLKVALPTLKDIPFIARGQMKREEQAARQANRVLICDTGLMMTAIYSRYYLGSCPRWIEEESQRRRYDLTLLTDTDIPWEPDSIQRDGPVVRDQIQRLIRTELDARDIPYDLISGSPEDRAAHATELVRGLFPSA